MDNLTKNFPILFFGVYSFCVIVYIAFLIKAGYKKLRLNKLLNKWIDETLKSFKENQAELIEKRNELIIDKKNGTLDSKKWEEEKLRFIHIEILNKAKQKLKDVQTINYLIAIGEELIDAIIKDSKDNKKFNKKRYIDSKINKTKDAIYYKHTAKWIIFILAILNFVILILSKYWSLSSLSFLIVLAALPLGDENQQQSIEKITSDKTLFIWFAIFILSVVSVVKTSEIYSDKLNEIKKKKEQEKIESIKIEKQKADIQRELERQTKEMKRKQAIEHFKNNKAVILEDLNYLINNNEYKKAKKIIDKYSFIDDDNLKTLKSHYNEKKAEYEKEENYKKRIPSHAYRNYNAEDFPELAEIVGSRLDEANKMSKKAAKQVIDSGKCDYVNHVILTHHSTPESLEFLIDCANEERMYLSEQQIENNESVVTESERGWDEVDAFLECRSMIKNHAVISRSVKFPMLGGSRTIVAPYTANVVIFQEFEAQNIYGTKIDYLARCSFRPGEAGEITINQR